MINYLSRLRAKKGFTLIELVVVIAIIAVLAAVILVAVSPDTGKREEANTAASSFYTAAQYVFTKYTKYEGDLSNEVADEIKAAKTAGSSYYLEYTKNLMGNYPTNQYTFLCVFVEKGKISYLHVNSELKNLLTDARGTTMTALEKQIMSDIEPYFVPSDGYYYAAVEHVELDLDTIKGTKSHSVRLHSAYFSRDQLPSSVGATDTYREENLLFKDSAKLANGSILGACTSRKSGSGIFIGEPGTYVMNVDSTMTITG